jgi:RNA polymerase sigma-70 factor, ECF subfamily
VNFVAEDSWDRIAPLIRERDEQALAAVFGDVQPRLLRFLRSQAPTEADDIASDVWLGVAKGVATFTGDWSSFQGWVFTIARRRLVDHRRMSARRRVDPVDAHGFGGRSTEAPIDEIVIDRLSGQAAANLVTRLLEPHQAEVVLLRVLGDLDADQIATIVGRTPGWVRVTQHRGFRRLADRMPTEIGVTRELATAI